MKSAKTIIALILTVLMAGSVLAACSGKDAGDGLYFSTQEVRKSPKWVTELDALKDTDQLIVIAGVDKNTAYITMHEKDKNGGCVSVPENIMRFIMQHVKPGCRITIDSLENMHGDLDS